MGTVTTKVPYTKADIERCFFEPSKPVVIFPVPGKAKRRQGKVKKEHFG